MTPEEHARALREAVRSGDWIMAERATRAAAWAGLWRRLAGLWARRAARQKARWPWRGWSRPR